MSTQVATTVNATKKLSVLIPDGENEHVLWVARSLANSKRVNLHILSNKRWTPVRFSRHCQHYQFKSTGTDYSARLEALADITKRVHIDVILPVSEDAVRFAVMEREALSELAALPPLPELESLRIARNKWLVNQFACQHHIPAPEAVLVTLDSAFEQRLIALKYPVLLKPTISTDGQGIRRFDTPADLQQFLASQDEKVFKNNYLIQTFVPGFDLGFSVLCRDGQILAYTIQRGIISAAHRFGPLMAMEFINHDEVLAAGQKLFAGLHWSGVAHVDFRYDNCDNQVKILEVNARYWGSLLGSVVAGVNFPYLACLAAQDIPFASQAYRLSKYAHTTTALKEGVLGLFGKNSVDGLNFRETGLRFFGRDPLPEVVKRVQEMGYFKG